MMSCSVYKLGGVGQGAAITARELSGYRSAGGEQLHCASLALYIIIIIIILLLLSLLFYFISIIKLFLSQPRSVSHSYSSDSLPHPIGVGGVSERLRGAELLAGAKPRQEPYRKSSISRFDKLFKLFQHQHVKRLHRF